MDHTYLFVNWLIKSTIFVNIKKGKNVTGYVAQPVLFALLEADPGLIPIPGIPYSTTWSLEQFQK